MADTTSIDEPRIRFPVAAFIVSASGVLIGLSCFAPLLKIGFGPSDDVVFIVSRPSVELTPLFDMPLFGGATLLVAIGVVWIGNQVRCGKVSMSKIGILVAALLVCLGYLVALERQQCGKWHERPGETAEFYGGGCVRDSSNTDPYLLSVIHDTGAQLKAGRDPATVALTGIDVRPGGRRLFLSILIATAALVFVVASFSVSKVSSVKKSKTVGAVLGAMTFIVGIAALFVAGFLAGAGQGFYS